MCPLFGDEAGGGKPLYLQLRDKLRRAILSGELPAGKLPSARDMAHLENVSRNTVDAAYAYLEDEGLVYVRRGQGTFVSEGACAPRAGHESAIDWEKRISRAARAFTHYREEEAPVIHGGRGVISFTSLAPDHNTFAVQAFRKIMNDVLAADDGRLLNYGYERGYEPLRQYLLADMRQKGINTDGQELIIVNGFRQAVELVTRVLVDENARVLTEAPTYNGVIGVLKSRMARIGAVDLDAINRGEQVLLCAPDRYLWIETRDGGSSIGRSKSDAFARRRSTCSMCRSATWFTSFSAGSACSRFGGSYSSFGRFLIARMMPFTVMFRLVISARRKPTMQRITAPTLLTTSSSTSASPPATTPPDVPAMPPSQRFSSTFWLHSTPPPPTSCTSDPISTATRNVHVTRSATGRPSCSSRIRKPIRNANGKM